MLRSDEPPLQEMTATALQDLASGSQRTRDATCAAGAVPLLVTLLTSDQPAVHAAAADALFSFTIGSQKAKDDIFAAGTVPLPC